LILAVKEVNFLIFQQKNGREGFRTDILKKQLYETNYLGNQQEMVNGNVQ